MLSFLQDTCDQIGQETLNEACEWAVANPAIALGVALGSTVLAVGGLFWSRAGHAAASSTPSAQPAVARMAQPRTREAFLSTVERTTVDKDALPQLPKVTAAPEYMPVQSIVTAYTKKIGQARLLPMLFPVQAGQIARTKSQAEINTAVLAKLGLPVDGHIPADREGRQHYNDVLDNLELPHLKLEETQINLRY